MAKRELDAARKETLESKKKSEKDATVDSSALQAKVKEFEVCRYAIESVPPSAPLFFFSFLGLQERNPEGSGESEG